MLSMVTDASTSGVLFTTKCKVDSIWMLHSEVCGYPSMLDSRVDIVDGVGCLDVWSGSLPGQGILSTLHAASEAQELELRIHVVDGS